MVSVGCFLMTALSGLTTVFSEDLISLTIKPRGRLKDQKKQILGIQCSSKGAGTGCSSVKINADVLSG